MCICVDDKKRDDNVNKIKNKLNVKRVDDNFIIIDGIIISMNTPNDCKVVINRKIITKEMIIEIIEIDNKIKMKIMII